MISPRSIALSGYGFGARAVALSGYVVGAELPPEPPMPPSVFVLPGGPTEPVRKQRDPRRQNEAILLALLH